MVSTETALICAFVFWGVIIAGCITAHFDNKRNERFQLC